FLVLASATAVSGWFWYKAQSEAERAQSETLRAKQEAERAHKVGNTTIATFNDLLEEIYDITTEMDNQPERIERICKRIETLGATITMDEDLAHIRWNMLDMRARLALSLGMRRRSTELYEQLIAECPPTSAYALRAHTELCGIGTVSEGRVHYEAAMNNSMTTSERCHLMRQFASALMREDMLDEALNILNSVECWKSDVERRLIFAQLYERLHRTSDALREFESAENLARRRFRSSPRRYFNKLRLVQAEQGLAAIEFQLGRHDDAFDHATDAVQLADQLLQIKPRHAPVMRLIYAIQKIRCDINLNRGMFREAIECGSDMTTQLMRLEAAESGGVASGFDRADTRYRLALAYHALGQQEQADIRIRLALDFILEARRTPGTNQVAYHARSADYLSLLSDIAEARHREYAVVIARQGILSTHLELTRLAPDDPNTESLIIQSAIGLSKARRQYWPAYDDDTLHLAHAALDRLRQAGADRDLIERRTAELQEEVNAVRQCRFPQSPWPAEAKSLVASGSRPEA
ncbi:MAG TPA: hypothetical protein P5081_16200, partial [Phycisphaerae bacterium]|nr:hypothetical protein [Phycisphaerae bacterium]HRW54413.1 hypothetical protein [Phycisphaerae bacterium]